MAGFIDLCYSTRTRLYGLIGSPVSHSLSPLIHGIVFREHGIPAVYLVWETRIEDLARRVEGLRSLAKGFNVTIPLKEAVVKHMSLLDESASVTGAVNTVKVEDDGSLSGYNTDYLGIIECLKEFKPRSILLIGAGGAARAAVYALALMGSEKLVVANRSRERALGLAKLAESFGLDTVIVGLQDAASYAKTVDTVVNATPVGSIGCCPDETPVSPEALHSGQVVFDMVYSPLPTRLLREARLRGARVVDGLCMLIWQAIHADRIWLGIEPSSRLYKSLRRRIVERLKG